MPRKPRKQRLSWFLIKEGVESDAIVRDSDDLRIYPTTFASGSDDALYVAPRAPTVPAWVRYVQPHVDGEVDVASASTAAVLLLTVEARTFALTFGYGRHLIAPEAVEQDFGLKVVLNSVAFDQIKSVDARTIDEVTLHTRRDVSRDSSFDAFGLDVSRDLVRAVVGTSELEGLEGRMTGSDALGINTRLTLPDLPILGSRLLHAYRDTAYKKHFDFIDHLRTERDPAVTQMLQDRLVQALRDREIDDLHLAIPEPIDWQDVEGVRFSSQPRDAELDTDPRISVYLDTVDTSTISIDRLKQDQVQAMSAAQQGDKLRGWSVFRCLVFETKEGDHLYTLSGGEWYRVANDFKQRVYDFVEALPPLDLDLPAATLGADEDAYIAAAAAHTGALSLDRRLARTSVTDPVEICDLLTADGTLVHIKKRGKSSTLSHLFAQGVTSGELLAQEPAFRAEAREIASKADPAFADVLPIDRPDRNDHEVAYVVITRSTRDSPLTLPFFSLVSLRAAAQRLDNIGLRVSVAAVPEQ